MSARDEAEKFDVADTVAWIAELQLRKVALQLPVRRPPGAAVERVASPFRGPELQTAARVHALQRGWWKTEMQVDSRPLPFDCRTACFRRRPCSWA